MADNQHNVSRRQALAGIGIAAAVPVVASPALAFTAQPNCTAWNSAVAAHGALRAQVDHVGRLVDAAFQAAETACPRQQDYYSRYKMSHTASRDNNFTSCHMSLVIERGYGRRLTEEEAKEVIDEARRLADDFEVYKARHDAAYLEYDQLQEQFDGVVDRQCEAFNALLSTPAPDGEAMQYKIELLAEWLTKGCSEGADGLNAIKADARRLLTVGRA